MSVAGRWRIVETDLWDLEALDLVAPAFIEFVKGGRGSLGFIAVEGSVEWRPAQRDGRGGAEFTWVGFDECDPVSGLGWVALQEDGSLRGYIYFHHGDDSGFSATREGPWKQ